METKIEQDPVAATEALIRKHREREAHCDALQALVDLLRAHPDLETPFDDYGRILNCVSFAADPKVALAAWARATSHLKPTKSYDDGDNPYANLDIDFGPGVKLHVYADREKVCERVVRGTRQVTETVKDPEMLAAVPQVEVTREEEIVDWVCKPLLDDGSSWASAS